MNSRTSPSFRRCSIGSFRRSGSRSPQPAASVLPSGAKARATGLAVRERLEILKLFSGPEVDHHDAAWILALVTLQCDGERLAVRCEGEGVNVPLPPRPRNITRRTSLPDSASQTIAVEPAPPDAISLPSFDQATARTVLSCPARSFIGSPLPAPHTTTGHLPSTFSCRIKASRFPSGDHETPADRRSGFFSASGPSLPRRP